MDSTNTVECIFAAIFQPSWIISLDSPAALILGKGKNSQRVANISLNK